MSLMVCPECNNAVSEFATCCPKCGCPRKKFQQYTNKYSLLANEEYLYCLVVFESEINKDNAKTYYYISDYHVDVGDVAVVSVGEYNEEKRVVIKRIIKVHKGEDAPFPPSKTKHIKYVVDSSINKSDDDCTKSYKHYRDDDDDDGDYCPHENSYDDYDDEWTDSDWRDWTGGESMEEYFDHEDY